MVALFAIPGGSWNGRQSRWALTFPCIVFFVVLRETLETSIIVSVLLAFLKQTLGPDRDAAIYKRLVNQVRQLAGLHSGGRGSLRVPGS